MEEDASEMWSLWTQLGGTTVGRGKSGRREVGKNMRYDGGGGVCLTGREGKQEREYGSGWLISGGGFVHRQA